jgi:hypothetical protein
LDSANGSHHAAVTATAAGRTGRDSETSHARAVAASASSASSAAISRSDVGMCASDGVWRRRRQGLERAGARSLTQTWRNGGAEERS